MKIKKFLEQEKSQKQVTKLLYALIVCVSLLLVVEILFQIPAIKNAFSTDTLSDTMSNNKIVWLVLWLLMFAQVTIIPVPAMPLYVFCNNTALVANGPHLIDLFSLRTLFFICYVVSACVLGSITAYALGKLGGRKAVKWVAGDEEEYIQWTRALNCKTGRFTYAATILLPVFPDDVLCLVAGAVGIDFKFFVMSNLIGRFICATSMLIFLRTPYISQFFSSSMNGGVPWALIVYSILLVTSLFVTIVWKLKLKKKQKDISVYNIN